MMPKVLRSKAGFTYIGALVMAVIVGIMASRAAVVWSTSMKREKEEELLSRGTQIRDAMRRWYKVKVVEGKLVPSTNPPTPAQNLPELKSLLLDSTTPAKLRYLRPFALVDPMTGKDWDVIRDTTQKIIGVRSTSQNAPLKQGNFPFDLVPADFEKKKKYSEWEFVYDRVPPPTPVGGPAKNTNGAKPPGA